MKNTNFRFFGTFLGILGCRQRETPRLAGTPSGSNHRSNDPKGPVPAEGPSHWRHEAERPASRPETQVERRRSGLHLPFASSLFDSRAWIWGPQDCRGWYWRVLFWWCPKTQCLGGRRTVTEMGSSVRNKHEVEERRLNAQLETMLIELSFLIWLEKLRHITESPSLHKENHERERERDASIL